MIGVDLVWVVLHKNIRDLVINYASRKKRNVNRGGTILNKEIELLELDINLDKDYTLLFFA